MNAIILAAGYGKRILSVTKKIPKCLIKVNKIPIRNCIKYLGHKISFDHIE